MVQYGEPVRPVKEVEAVGMEVSPKGETIIDFGQNLAGVLRVKVDLPAGTKLIQITLRPRILRGIILII